MTENFFETICHPALINHCGRLEWLIMSLRRSATKNCASAAQSTFSYTCSEACKSGIQSELTKSNPARQKEIYLYVLLWDYQKWIHAILPVNEIKLYEILQSTEGLRITILQLSQFCNWQKDAGSQFCNHHDLHFCIFAIDKRAPDWMQIFALFGRRIAKQLGVDEGYLIRARQSPPKGTSKSERARLHEHFFASLVLRERKLLPKP